MANKTKKKNGTDATAEEFILKKFQSLKEEALTKNYIIPLFKVLGFYDVDYHGGPYEEGKDIICWKDDELDQPELAVIQVKKFKPSAKASDSSAFIGLVNQLQQAAEKEIPSIDGSKYFPSKVFFITPYQIDTRSLQSRFEAYASLKHRGVKIIDGPLLIKHLKNKIPHLISELIGKEVQIKEATISNLTNRELLNALKYNETIDISSFYSDLDFGIGRITTQFFFSLDFKPAKFSFACSLEDWISIKEIALFIQKQFSVRFLVDEATEIEKKFDIEKNEYRNELEYIKNLASEIDSHKKQIKSLAFNVKKVVKKINDNYSKYSDELSAKGVQQYSNFIEVLEYFNIEDNDQKEDKIKLRKDEEYKKIIKKYNIAVKFPESKKIGLPEHKKLLDKHEIITREIRSLSNKISKQRKKLKEPQYTGYVTGHELSKKLQDLQRWLQAETEIINKSNKSTHEIREFLILCKGLFDKTERVLENSYVEKALGRTSGKKIRKVEEIPRLRIPIKEIFNTGLNIFVLGEAGAGKTTSLQMYAKFKSENSGISDTCIFLPLGQMISAFDKKYSKKIKASDQKKFLLALIQFFRILDLELSEQELKHLFKTKNITLLLDGLDEIIGKASWILKAVNDLKESFPKIQLIVSSRMSGNYLDEIPFIGISLLPFTDDQRESFIHNWFQDKDEDKTAKLIKHLNNNKSLTKIVRVPLLTNKDRSCERSEPRSYPVVEQART